MSTGSYQFTLGKVAGRVFSSKSKVLSIASWLINAWYMSYMLRDRVGPGSLFQDVWDG